jgi:hypothetical protein
MAKLPVPIFATEHDTQQCVQPVALQPDATPVAKPVAPKAGLFWTDDVPATPSIYHHHGVIREFASFADAYADYIERCKRRKDDIEAEMQEVRDLIVQRELAIANFCEAIATKRAEVKALRNKRMQPAPRADDYER